MKDLFPEYRPAGDKVFSKIWSDALFVFDTNVLLNLYRYRVKTRDELLAILEKIADRVWIPHQVALEFQRNRLTVISDQNKKFSEVRNTVQSARNALEKGLHSLQLKERHALIDPDELVAGVDAVINGFLNALDRLEGEQQTLTGTDPLKTRIEEIFHKKVGAPIADQETLDAIYAQAEERFEKKLPPGFRDDSKEDEYRYRGLLYKPKYGDVLVWSQMLAYSKAESIKCMVFVTDDNKEDWWQKVKTASGNQTIGPRIELMEEALLNANVESVLFYRPASFLQNAKEFFAGEISQETIDEVLHVSVETPQSETRQDRRRKAAKAAISAWLSIYYDEVAPHRGDGYADLIAMLGEEQHAFDIRAGLRSVENAAEELADSIEFVLEEESYRSFEGYTIVFVLHGDAMNTQMKRDIDSVADSLDLNGIHLMFGTLLTDSEGKAEFKVLYRAK